VTEAGTLAAVEFELESETTAPPEPAGPFSVTVPAATCPPATVLGLTEMLLSVTIGKGVTVIGNVVLTPE